MPVAIKSTGGGSVTLTAPNTASDLTLTLPSATGTVATTGSPTFTGDVTFPGTGVWNSSGNVGIGTISPGYNLEVYGSGAFLGGITRATTSTDAGAIFTFSTLNASSAKTSMADILGAASTTTAGAEAGYLSFRTKTSGSMTEKVRIDASGNLQFNSGYGSVATAYGCRAWVSYNGSTQTLRASGGITSVTRNSTGDYTLNFNFTMPDTNYNVVGSGPNYNAGQAQAVSIKYGSGVGYGVTTPTLKSTTQVTVVTGYGAQYSECPDVNVSVFR